MSSERSIDAPVGGTGALVAARREALRRAGLTQAGLATRIGVSRQSVGLVMADHHRSRRVEQAIADAVGVAVEQLFPTESAPLASTRAPPAASVGPVPPASDAARADTRMEPPVASPAAGGVEGALTAQLHALGRDVLLALAAGRLGIGSPVVRAVASALRELDRDADAARSHVE